MRKMQLVCKLFLFALLVSCGSDPVELPQGAYEKGVLIINEGAFGANDGEVFHFDKNTAELETNVFENVNGRPFAGLLQDLISYEDYTYLVANTGKVEVVQSADFISVGTVNNDLVNSRSMVKAEGKLYISDWGPYDANWNNTESFVAVVEEVTGGDIAYKIPTPSRPEGITFIGDRILVACQMGAIAVIEVGDDEVEKTIAVTGTPFFFFEYQGSNYLYAKDSEKIYLHKLDVATFEVEESLEFSVDNSIYNGNFSVSNNGELFVISNQATEDVVVKLSLATESVEDENFFSGSNFYGLGYDDDTQTLYIGEHNGWQGNGSVMRVNAQGELIDEVSVGRGPSGFYFP
jgi:hypothetical protein